MEGINCLYVLEDGYIGELLEYGMGNIEPKYNRYKINAEGKLEIVDTIGGV